MIRNPAIGAALLLLAACATAAHPAGPAQASARFDEAVRIGALRVTPRNLVEDSRCPRPVACVWAGRVRIDVQVNGRLRQLTLAEPVPVSRGNLALVEVLPQRQSGVVIARGDYRFTFRFEPG